MKKLALVGFLAAFSVLGIASVLAPARAAGDGMPVGTILAWAGDAGSLPAGWMLCDGKAMNTAVYKELYAVIGRRWGGSGFTFYLPDLRGRFLRGDDDGAGRDPDAKKRTPSKPGGSATGVGSVQEDSLQNHKHDQTSHRHQFAGPTTFYDIADTGAGTSVMSYAHTNYDTTDSAANILGATRHNTKSQVNAGEETRPKNACVHFIIKVR